MSGKTSGETRVWPRNTASTSSSPRCSALLSTSLRSILVRLSVATWLSAPSDARSELSDRLTRELVGAPGSSSPTPFFPG